MLNKGIKMLLLSTGAIIFPAAQSIDTYVNKPYAERQGYFLKEFYSNPVFHDSIAYFKKVNALQDVALKNNDKELWFETKLMRFNYLSSKNYKPYKKEMLALISEIDETKSPQLKARARQALGLHYFYENMNYADALMYLSKSYDIIKDIPVSQLPDKQEMVYNIAFVNYNIGYYNTALKYLDIAAPMSNPYWKNLQLNIINLKGLILKEKGFNAKALETFEELLQKSQQQKDAIYTTLAACHISDYYKSIHQYERAYHALVVNTSGVEDEKLDLTALLSKKILFAELNIDRNHQTEALAEIQSIQQILDKNKGKTTDRFNQEIIPLLAYAKGKNGEFDESFKMMRQALLNEANNKTKEKTELVRQLDNKENIEKYFQYISDLDAEKKNKKIMLISAISVILLLIIAAIFFLQKQRLRYRQKQLKVKLQKKELSLKLKTANLELRDMKEFLLSQNAEMEQYKDELLALEQSNSPQEEKERRTKQLNELLNSKILTEQNWIDFKRVFDEVHDGYIIGLSNQMPGLTEAELRYLLLRKMSLTPKQIASMLGVSPDSIRQYKYRIRKKFNFENEDELESELSKIS